MIYAIVGETVWVLTGQRAMKYPLSQIDVDKTFAENQQRGIEFTIPPAR